MLVPPAFAVSDQPTLHRFVARHSFGVLVSQVGGLPFATHLPFVLRPDDGPHGTLVGHLARPNPQWRELAGQTAMAVFSGPHAYVSPTWYEAENVVPTWNYTAVHAYGRVEAVDGGEPLMAILRESVREFERGMPRPWAFAGAGPFAERLAAQVVGFRMAVERFEGQFKLSQNHPAERRHKVVRALEGQGDENSRGVAELMRRTLPADG